MDADETKTLVSIKLTPNLTQTQYCYPLYVISAWKTQTVAELLATVTANISREEAKAIVSAVNKTLADNYITVDDLADETKAKYLVAKACANTLEVVSAGYEASKVTVQYKTGADTSAKVIVAEYENGEEVLSAVKIFVADFTASETVKEFSYEATTGNVKVLVWKDLVDFFPYGK